MDPSQGGQGTDDFDQRRGAPTRDPSQGLGGQSDQSDSQNWDADQSQRGDSNY